MELLATLEEEDEDVVIFGDEGISEDGTKESKMHPDRLERIINPQYKRKARRTTIMSNRLVYIRLHPHQDIGKTRNLKERVE